MKNLGEKFNFKEIIQYHIDEKLLICIERKNITNEPLWGFPILLTDQVLLMTKIDDFRDEGIVLIRPEDVTDAFSKESDQFYEYICIQEGLYAISRKWKEYCSIQNFQTFIARIDCSNQFMTIQCENNDELYFSIGKPEKIINDSVYFYNFDKNGIWEDTPRKIPIKDITLIAVGDYYSKLFYKYMSIR